MTLYEIRNAVCLYFGVSVQRLTEPSPRGRRGHRDAELARMTGMYLARELTLHSYPTIAGAFGRDHSTAVSNVRRIDTLRWTDPKVRDALDELRTRLRFQPDALPCGGGC